MQFYQHFAGAIWTNHALQRLRERKLEQKMAAHTFTHPDRKIAGNERGSFHFQKRFGSSTVTVVAKQNETNEWIVLSCWIDPPYPGTTDAKRKQAYRAYQRASFWGKVWRLVLKQLGILNF